MSEFFSGITFPWQKVTPSDDASVRRSVLADGILSGCEISYIGSTLTMGAGLLIGCGRQFRHTAVQNFAVTGASSGYARLVITIDTTKASTKDAFDQIGTAIEYATALDGFTQLRQDDINEAGTVYQMQICVVSLGAGGIAGIVKKIPGTARKAFAYNLLDNSDFTNPVNQRGVTSETGAVWTHIVDRWYINLQAGVTATLTESGLSVSGDCFIQQRFEKGYLRADTVYTSAVYYSDGSVELSSKPEFHNTGFDAITIYIEANKTVAHIALYEGEYTTEALPEYQPKGYGAELAECQRYYQRSYTTEPTSVYSTHILTAASNYAIGTVFFYVPMRIAPTVTIYNPVTGTSSCVAKWSDDSNVSVTHEQNTRCVYVNASGGSAVKGEAYALHYEASADL